MNNDIQAAQDDQQTTPSAQNVQSDLPTLDELLARLMAQCVEQGKLYERTAKTWEDAQAIAKKIDDQSALIQATRAAISAKLASIMTMVNTFIDQRDKALNSASAHHRDYGDARDFIGSLLVSDGTTYAASIVARIQDFLANH